MRLYITYFEIAAFLASIIAWPSIKRSAFLKWFPILLFVVAGTEVYTSFIQPVGFNNALIYNIQVPFQHIIYLIILHLALNKVQYRKILRWMLITFIAFSVTSFLTLNVEDEFNVVTYCVGSVFIIVGILIKFYEMLQNPVDFNFMKDPFFYMLFAFLLFNVGTLPYFTMSNWLFYVKNRKDIVMMLIDVMSVFNYVLYITYTVAFVWMMQRKDSSL